MKEMVMAAVAAVVLVVVVFSAIMVKRELPREKATEPMVSKEEAIMKRADEVVLGLMGQNMQKVAEKVEPNGGVTFWPYGNSGGKTVKLTRDEVNNWWKDNKKYLWGMAAGSGKEIEMNKKDYYNRYIYDKDFAGAEVISFDRVTRGSGVEVINEAFPGAHWVEYYFSGFDPKYEGMDWVSLKLVFEEKDGNWWLGGVIHDQWTP